MHKGLSIFLLLFPVAAWGQDITGTVSDTVGNPVEGAIISIFPDTASQDALTYCLSDSKGRFHCTFDQKNHKQVIVKISSLGYTPVTVVAFVPLINALKVILSVDATELQEVIIHSGITKDTIGIDTRNLNLTGNSTLRDILDRTEGFMVTKEGGISYNGVPINKVLINKKEVFINQNKIALDNLNYEMMDSIQVINNYRDRFHIDYDNFTSPVLNINAKSNFTGVLKSVIEGGAGYKNAFQVKPKAMYFSAGANIFATGNVNNIGEKDISNNDILAPLVDKTTGYFKSLLRPFFTDDDLLKKDINANLSLTARRQSAGSKTGIVFHYDYMNREKQLYANSRIATPPMLAKNERNVLKDIGNLFTIDYYYSRLLGSKTSLNYTLDIARVKDEGRDQVDIETFFPDSTLLSGMNKREPDGYVVANGINLQSLIQNNVLFASGLDYTKQYASYHLNTSFTDQAINNVSLQDIFFYRDGATFFLSGKYRVNNLLVFELKPQIALFKETNKIHGLPDKREVTQLTTSFFARGQNRKMEYYFEAAPDIYFFPGPNSNKILPRIDASFDYFFSPPHHIVIKINRYNNLIDFNNIVDTLNNSYNSLLVTSGISKYSITQKEAANVGYYYSNIIRSESFHLLFNYSGTDQSLQPFFQTINDNNIYYYRNVLTSKSSVFNIKTGAGKGYYLSNKNHKLNFTGGLSYNRSNMPYVDFSTNSNFRYQSEGFSYNMAVSFQHNGRLTNEFKLIYFDNINNIKLAGQQYDYRTHLWGAELFCHKDRLEIKTSFYYTLNRNNTMNFSTPLLNVSASYRISDKLSIYLRGKALADLFKLRKQDFSSYQLVSEGLLINEIFNRYRISYLLAGISYKF